MTRPFISHSIVANDIHFNSNHPENHNLMIPNKNKNQVVIKTSSGKQFRKKSEVIQELIYRCADIIESQYNEAKTQNLTSHQQYKMQKFGKFLDKSHNDKDTEQFIQDETSLAILNGQNKCNYKSWI